jgi:hypothetical protein
VARNLLHQQRDGGNRRRALRKLPTSEPGLRAELHRRWEAGRTGPDALTDGFTIYVWTTAQDLLAGPITPGTKAALYRVLAAQRGIRSVGEVKDALGRTGVALAMPVGKVRTRWAGDGRDPPGRRSAHRPAPRLRVLGRTDVPVAVRDVPVAGLGRRTEQATVTRRRDG